MPTLRTIAVAAPLFLLGGCVGGAFTVYSENDLYSLRGRADHYYTQGLRLSRVFATGDAPLLARQIAQEMPLYDDEETTTIGVVLGQNVYTPNDIRLARAQDQDRPYAGWLYGGVMFSKQKMNGEGRTDDRQETVELDAGVVGDPSLGRSFQTRWHRFIGSPRPRGWSHQIRFEPGLVAMYERRDRAVFEDDLPLGTEFDLLPGYGASVGNVDTHAGASARVRFGLNLPRDFGVNTISTTAMEVADKGLGDRPSVHLFGAAEGRAVARNIFLDGNTFGDGPSVEKDLGVAEFRGGLCVQYKALRLSYAWITRSPEFHGQHGWTRYGSLSLGLFLDF